MLIVDDEPINRDSLSEVFKDEYQVLTAASGPEALAMATEAEPDLILLDVMMPGMDGYEVCKRLKQAPQTRGIPVVFVTGLDDETAEIRGLALGAADYVHKPIVSAVMKARVNNLITLGRTQRELVRLAEEKQRERMAVLLQRYAEKEDLNRKIGQALADKEVLLKELHHRVKNNLQVICSMLGLQAGTLQDAAAVAALQNCQSRVQSIAIIHDLLYGSTALSHLDFSAYAQRLLREVASTYGVDLSRIRLRSGPAPQFLDMDHAIPCGLILNELITNSLKHAFPASGPGEINVSLEPHGAGSLCLTVEDNGVGLPRDFDLSTARSLGLRIVHILTEQVRGRLTVHSGPGAKFDVTFPFEWGRSLP